jgi:hypothetical protein
MPSRLLPATVQPSAQLARQRDPMAVIDALDCRAQSRGLYGIATCHKLNANNRALLAVCCSGQFDSGTPT